MSDRAYRQFASAAVDGLIPRALDFASAFACDAIEQNGRVADTAFRTMSGAGHQHFLKSMKDLVGSTSATQIGEALLGPWEYADDPPVMRWDPEDD